MAKSKKTVSTAKEISNKQILDVAKAASYEMDVPKEVIFQAIEAALEMATKKRHLRDIHVKVEIDRNTGDYHTYRCWTVFDENNAEEEPFNADYHMTLDEALEKNPEAEIGSEIKEPMESVEFGRIAAQTAKQVIVQKVREAKRAKMVNAYRDSLNQLVSGLVKKVSREGILVDLGEGAEALIPREEMIPGETVRMGDRLRAYLYDIQTDAKGPQLLLSRASKEMLLELFKIEVPEIGEEIIQIKAIAREPGVRAKLAVKTNDGRIDPIGACVGMRGSRVQVISNELAGERIDIILWDDNPAQLVINAMAPAEVASIVMDEDSRTMDIAVDPEQLSQAIGRNGQNVRLASELTGWTLNVMTEEDAQQKSNVESERLVKMFVDKMDVDEEIAAILVREGFTSLEEVAYVPIQEFLNIEEFDEDIVQALRDRAKEILESNDNRPEPAQDLLTMKGMDEDLAYKLAANEIITMEDLAEQSVEELMDIEGMTEARAAELIMTAREPWFE